MPSPDNTLYPQRLLPLPGEKLIVDLDLSEHLCRWTNPEFPLKDESGKLNAMAIEEKRLFHYSVNKIPRSTVEDICIEFPNKSPFLDTWELDKTPLPKISQNDFTIEINRGFFLLQIKDIHLHIGQYPYPSDNETFNCQFKVEVIHAPLMVNFMHFELHIFDDEGNLLSELKKKSWRKIIVAELRQHLIEVAKFQL